jgi:hypothetical protein
MMRSLEIIGVEVSIPQACSDMDMKGLLFLNAMGVSVWSRLTFAIGLNSL